MSIFTLVFLGLLPSVAIVMFLTSAGGVLGFAGGVLISALIFRELV